MIPLINLHCFWFQSCCCKPTLIKTFSVNTPKARSSWTWIWEPNYWWWPGSNGIKITNDDRVVHKNHKIIITNDHSCWRAGLYHRLQPAKYVCICIYIHRVYTWCMRYVHRIYIYSAAKVKKAKKWRAPTSMLMMIELFSYAGHGMTGSLCYSKMWKKWKRHLLDAAPVTTPHHQCVHASNPASTIFYIPTVLEILKPLPKLNVSDRFSRG